MLREIIHRPISGGIFLKRQLYQRSAFLVQHNCPLFAPLIVHPADIEVTERCAGWRPAAFDFFTHPLFDFVRQILRVELSNRAHDAMEQHSRRGVVDTLRGRYQLDTALSERPHNVDVVAPVSSQSVNLMDDDIVHSVSVFFDILQHLLEFRAVGRLGGRAPIDKLFANNRPHGEGFSFVRLPLGGDGKSLVRTAAALRLSPCRYTQVGYGELWRHISDERFHHIVCRKTHLKGLLSQFFITIITLVTPISKGRQPSLSLC
nr:hypothetical protein [Acutalibacter sp. 1XD8-33]